MVFSVKTFQNYLRQFGLIPKGEVLSLIQVLAERVGNGPPTDMLPLLKENVSGNVPQIKGAGNWRDVVDTGLFCQDMKKSGKMWRVKSHKA